MGKDAMVPKQLQVLCTDYTHDSVIWYKLIWHKYLVNLESRKLLKFRAISCYL